MGQDQDTTIENSRASIKSDIEMLITADQVLRQQLKPFEPISSLPPEIMVDIFSFVRDVSPHPLHWIKVTHVCAYWRNAAIHAPTLWCRPPLANLPWTVEMLARSKQVDITLESDSHRYYTGQPEGYGEALQHAARIRHISLDFSKSTEEWQSRVVGNLPMSAPHLETLLINIGLWDEDLSIPGNALVDAPNLRRLELTNCGPNWDAHWLPQITHLQICSISDSAQLTRSSLMTALRKMQNLESLILFYLFPSDIVTSDKLDQVPLMNINLVHLRVLCIWDRFFAVGTFFRHVTFPPEAAVHVTMIYEFYTDPQDDGVSWATILRNIAKSYSNIMAFKVHKKSSAHNFDVRDILFVDLPISALF